MSKRHLPPDLIESSISSLSQFANVVVPLLARAIETARSDVFNYPEGGAPSERAEAQLFPSIVRLRMHQLVEGHNAHATPRGVPKLAKGPTSNGAVCLLCGDQQFRVLKGSNRFPTRASGFHQERLITQHRYWSSLEEPPLFAMEVSLDGLIYYRVKRYELVDAFVLIPNGFDDNGRVIEVERRPVDWTGAYDQAATFVAPEPMEIAGSGSGLLVAQGLGALQSLSANEDPYEDVDEVSSEVAELAEDSHFGGLFAQEKLDD